MLPSRSSNTWSAYGTDTSFTSTPAERPPDRPNGGQGASTTVGIGATTIGGFTGAVRVWMHLPLGSHE